MEFFKLPLAQITNSKYSYVVVSYVLFYYFVPFLFHHVISYISKKQSAGYLYCLKMGLHGKNFGKVTDERILDAMTSIRIPYGLRIRILVYDIIFI